MDQVEKLFQDLDEYYPGSKRKRRPIDPNAKPKVVKEKESWDAHPQVKTLPNGRVIELFSAGSLCLALGRPLVTVRLWERKGYIPRAPYRLKSMIVDGVKKPGWRMYSRAMIESAVKSFDARNLLQAPRIDWNKFPDLSLEIADAWRRIHEQETTNLA